MQRMRGMTWRRVALALVLVAGSAFGAAEEQLEKARALYEQAEPLVATAENPDEENSVRDEARRNALKLLKEARDAFQDWQSKNGENADDPVGPKIGKLLYWVKKMSKIGDDAPPTPRPPSPPPGPAPEPGPATPPAPGPNPEPGPAPGPGPGPKDAPPPQPPADAGQKAREGFAWLQDLEKKLKSDPAALKAAYEQFLADNPDPALPEYQKAVARVGELQDELNRTFKEIAKKDPEQLDNVDSKMGPKVLFRLQSDLHPSKGPEVRRNAVKLMGLARSGAASYSLGKLLVDDDEEIVKLAADALVQIGGWRTGEVLTKEYRDRSHESQAKVLDVLVRIAKKGPIDAQSISHWMGRFVLSPDGEIANEALIQLERLGADGGPGLVEAMKSRRPDKQLAVMDAIAKVKYYRGAGSIAVFLLRGDGSAVEVPRARAQKALLDMGIHSIPYMLDALADGRTKTWTTLTLRQMTGANLNSVAEAKRWYEMNKGSGK